MTRDSEINQNTKVSLGVLLVVVSSTVSGVFAYTKLMDEFHCMRRHITRIEKFIKMPLDETEVAAVSNNARDKVD